ncbi:response regulator [Actinomadura barringtoniae]|uniref:histidine kinase n=1 Tax=Actinomadura barringtoniae TaxID=1427535 RepID=A0A939T3F0_9ACTN|nr:chemotaxis protein CheB [Actinomadura barringtoniae]MBO2448013.1 response regulator [Actinomadura barringtoniae]
MPGSRERAKIDIVALVASAGGMGALTAVLRNLPVGLPVPVVIQQHLGGKATVLPTLLGRHTSREIGWAIDGALLKPGEVVICPAGMRTEVLPDATCSLTPVGPPGTRAHSHDLLLSSLADSFGPRALAVVLSGSGNDGAAGTARLTAAGGLVIAQSANTAEHDSMPRAAAEAGAALVLDLHEIGAAIAGIVDGEPVPLSQAEAQAIDEAFGGPSVMERAARGLDWANTPLGPVGSWEPALRTMVRTVMASPRQTSLLWGEQHVLIFNDAELATGGDEHARRFALPLLDGRPELRPSMEPVFRRVLDGETVELSTLLWTVPRRGGPGHAWFDVSFTPVRDAHGEVTAILRASTERTTEVLAARRLRALQRLAALPTARNDREALEGIVSVLAEEPDVLFAVAYLVQPSQPRADLAGAAGVHANGPLARRELRLAPGDGWPLDQALTRRAPIVVDDIAVRFLSAPDAVDTVDAPGPERAVVHPLVDEAADQAAGALILGTDPRLPFDGPYREFLTLVARIAAGRLVEARSWRRMEELSELERARADFFSNVSHEFGTPLTLMLGPLEQLRRDPGRPAAERMADVELVDRNARRLLRLVATLLDLSQAGRPNASFVRVDLGALTEEIVAAFGGAAERAGLALVVEVPPAPAQVTVDVEMWEKIVSHLLSNALKFTWNGSVEVALRILPRHAELTVRDTGVGIPSAELPYVFQRFHRVRETRGRSNEGAGIGLSLVHELVRVHTGRIRVTSEPGSGTTFTVWIPSDAPFRDEPGDAAPKPVGSVAAMMADEADRWDPERETADLDHDLAADAGNAGDPGRRAPGARILVVDDNADMREYLARLLGASWQVVEATDGDRALELAVREPPDLLLADVRLPGMDGFTLLRKIRSDPALTGLPVILLTARAGEETAIEGLLAGADDYVVKPFTARELLARVGAQLVLSRTRRAVEERLLLVMETENVGVLYFDPTGTVVDANQAFLKMTGYTREQVDRRKLHWQEMTPPEWIAVSDAQMVNLDATGRIGPYEKEYFMADGSRRWMLFAGRALGDGTISEFCIDITDIKNRESRS